MASELSRLIDDELEKFERRPSADNREKQKASFSIKAGIHKAATGQSYSFRQKEWWTWKRITYVVLIAVILVGLLVLLPRGSAAAKTALAGSNNAAISQSGEAVGAGFSASTGTEASPSASTIPKHSRSSTIEDEQAASSPLSTETTLNHTESVQVNGSSAAPFPSASEVASSPGNLENAPAPSTFGGAVIERDEPSSESPSPVPSAFGGGLAPGPSAAEALKARAPSSVLKFSLGRRLLHR